MFPVLASAPSYGYSVLEPAKVAHPVKAEKKVNVICFMAKRFSPARGDLISFVQNNYNR